MKARFILCVMFVLSIVGPAAIESGPRAGKLKVFVSILPLAYFVERVAGSHVEISCMVGPGQDVHTFDPPPQTVAKLAKADAYFVVGLPFEDTLRRKARSTCKDLEFVDTRKGITLRVMTGDEIEEHKEGGHRHHGDKGGHDHGQGEPDPHVWLDPKLAKVQAANIAEALSRMDPDHAEEYAANLSQFQGELDELDTQLVKALAQVKGKPFYVYHPAWGYFGDAYGLKQVSVETGGKEPSAKHLAALIKEAKKDGVRIIFVQPQFSRKSAETLAQTIGGAVLALDDLGRDYMNNMREMAEKITTALAEQKN